jgi:hypothetical protein
MSRSERGDPAADLGGFVGTLIAAAIVTAVVLTLRFVVMEAIRVYRARAGSGDRAARLLWYALAGLLLAIGLSIVLAAAPAALAPWPAALGFLAWVVTIEVVDLASGIAPPSRADLADPAGPWRFGPPGPPGAPAAPGAG